LINRKIIEGSSNAFAGVVGVNGIQTYFSDSLGFIDGKRHEADNQLVDQGNVDSVMRIRVAHACQMFSLLGISLGQSESRYRLADNFPERAKYGLKGYCAYSLNCLKIGSFESSDMNVGRHGKRPAETISSSQTSKNQHQYQVLAHLCLFSQTHKVVGYLECCGRIA
jgi:hypothetical protein